MGKIVAWIAIGVLAWAVWRLVSISRRRVARAREQSAPGAGAAAPGGDAQADGDGARRLDAPERMMQCAVCGVHLPGSEARFAGGRVYCSDAHRDQASAERAPHDRG